MADTLDTPQNPAPPAAPWSQTAPPGTPVAPTPLGADPVRPLQSDPGGPYVSRAGVPVPDGRFPPGPTPPLDPHSDPVGQYEAHQRGEPATDQAAAEAKEQAEAREKFKAAAKKDEPTPEEVDFVARAMHPDIDWENRPERGENARVLARQVIVGHRAVARVGEAPKKAFGPAVKIVSIGWVAGVVTVKTAEPCPVSPGGAILLDGNLPVAYNGRHKVVTVLDATHFTFAHAVDPGVATEFGTVAVAEAAKPVAGAAPSPQMGLFGGPAEGAPRAETPRKFRNPRWKWDHDDQNDRRNWRPDDQRWGGNPWPPNDPRWQTGV